MSKPSFKNYVKQDNDLVKETTVKVVWTPIKLEEEVVEKPHTRRPGLKSLKEQFVKELGIKETKVSLIEETKKDDLVEEKIIEEVVLQNDEVNKDIVLQKTKTIIDKASEYIAKQAKLNEQDSFQQPNVQVVEKNLEAVTSKLNQLEKWISKIASHGPGSGEVRLKYLDDIDRNSIGENKHLAYNATSDTFFFEAVVPSSEIVADGYTTNISGIGGNVVSVINLPQNTPIGPIETLTFNVNHTHQEVRVPGTLCWDPSDNTLNLTHPNDVVQQIGQESYVIVRNKTGNTILNGQCVRFDGAEMNGTARITVAPFLADGTFPSLYTLGVATSNIAANADGFATVFGKVRDIDTTGNTAGETWYVGNILYANPTIAGALTAVKPTAPFNVVPVAAVLRVDTTEGEIFVRPTIEQKASYGRFARTTDVAVGTINTAANIVFDTTVISNGVTLGTPASKIVVDQSGYYGINVSGQIDVGGGFFNTGTMYLWLRKNGTDVEQSMIRQAVSQTNSAQHIQQQFEISLDANDFIELMYAGDDTELQFEASAATAFGPNTAAVFCTVNQLQL